MNAELPWEFKNVTIAPISKKGSKADPVNYHPVSLTPVLCKLSERCIADSINQHIRDNNLHARSNIVSVQEDPPPLTFLKQSTFGLKH